MELHFLNVLMSLIDELGRWDWNSAFHQALTAYFFLGCVPQFILLTTEVQGYRISQPHRIEGEFVDDAFIVDYVRVFAKMEE